jgi:hypothetical protein
VSAKTRWKKKTEQTSKSGENEKWFCVKWRHRWFENLICEFFGFAMSSRGRPPKNGKHFYWLLKKLCKKGWEYFFLSCLRLTFIITWNNLTFHIWVIWVTELNSTNHVFKRLYFDNFKWFEVKSFYIILEELFQTCGK